MEDPSSFLCVFMCEIIKDSRMYMVYDMICTNIVLWVRVINKGVKRILLCLRIYTIHGTGFNVFVKYLLSRRSSENRLGFRTQERYEVIQSRFRGKNIVRLSMKRWTL